MGGCGFCSGSYISTHFNISRTKTLFRPQSQTEFVGKWPSRIRVCSRWSESWLLLVRLHKFAHMQFETMCKAERCNGAKTTLFAVGQATYSRGRMFIRVCAEWMLYSHVKCSVSTSMVFFRPEMDISFLLPMLHAFAIAFLLFSLFISKAKVPSDRRTSICSLFIFFVRQSATIALVSTHIAWVVASSGTWSP